MPQYVYTWGLRVRGYKYSSLLLPKNDTNICQSELHTLIQFTTLHMLSKVALDHLDDQDHLDDDQDHLDDESCA